MLFEEGQERAAERGEGQGEEEEEPGDGKEELNFRLAKRPGRRRRGIVGYHVGESDGGAERGDADDGGEEAVEEGADAVAGVPGHGLNSPERVASFARPDARR